METIIFIDDTTGEEVEFEIIDQLQDNNETYLLVADADDEALVLKEVNVDGDEVTYALVEDEHELQKITLLFLESDEYDIEI